jgi:thiamine biosynthesis lipoprotein
MRKFILLGLCLALLALSCERRKESAYKKSSMVMDTVVSITAVSGSADHAEKAIDAAFEELRRLEGLLSFWTEESEIALINKNAGIMPVRVSPETLETVEKSIFISGQTEGAFDPTIGPLIRLWDFNNKTMPSPEDVEQAVSLVNYGMIETRRDESTVFLKDPRMSFDTGGIAKGYAADRAVLKLKGMGIKAGLVAVAGDIRAFGRKPDGTPWTVGIRNPRASGSDDGLIAYVELEEEAISTSGDYERFFIKDGIRYHHIMAPRTGYPARECISATVIAPEGVLTDGLSTGVFVMGPEKGIELLEQLGYHGIIITPDGKTHLTRKMKHRLRWAPGFSRN